MGNNASSNYIWARTYSEIRRKHDEAFTEIEQAISLEEQEKPNEAIEKYKIGIQLIDEALNIQVTCPEDPDETWQKACTMIQKIKRTRAEVLTRINSIQSLPNFVPTEETVTTTTNSDIPRTYVDLATALNQLSIDPNEKNDEELLYIHDNVQLYFISPSGEVVSTTEPQILKISVISENSNGAKAVLRVGDFVYPLIPGVSPCYRTTYGAFILPDVHSPVPNSSIGIILPSDCDEEVFDLLENILHGIISEGKSDAILRSELQPSTSSEELSSTISNKIIDGAYLISNGLVRGAEKIGDFMNYTSPKIINNINRPDEPTTIPRPLSKSIQIAETATSKAACVTGYVADKVGIATMKLGRFLAPHIQKQGSRLLAVGFNMPKQEAENKVRGILTVAAGAVEGFSTVYRGLESSASILGNSLKNNTVKIVNHKYGSEAGELTGGALDTVGNVYNINRNAKILTPKGLVKKTAKSTGFAVVYPHISNHGNAENQLAAGTSNDNEHLMTDISSDSQVDLKK